MKRILITSGPVHSHLDDVKIITNRFKGGLMASLANQMVGILDPSLQKNDKDPFSYNVTYLSSKDTKKPDDRNPTRCGPAGSKCLNLHFVEHDGFDDYMQKVLELAPTMDGIILGAAVANLIPKNPIKGKFPSHNYKPGDVIPIEFTIAPRVINEIKKVAPHTHLFGFKLLSNVTKEELIHAAYTVVQESGATAVFANDATNLNQVYAVTKERAVHPLCRENIVFWLRPFLEDEYYRTVVYKGRLTALGLEDFARMEDLIQRYKDRFITVEGDYIFGTVAVRLSGNAFLTTGRGKKELDHFVIVHAVDHKQRLVIVDTHGAKATLNAPLLSYIFENLPRVDAIVHYHQCDDRYPYMPYAPPGTVRDSIRSQVLFIHDIKHPQSFNIENHGCFLLLNRNGDVL